MPLPHAKTAPQSGAGRAAARSAPDGRSSAATRVAAGPALQAFRRRLLGWFRRAKRDLPWRQTHDPYRIWLSEVMLQQTRVATVLPYYARFLRRWPTLRDLARARPEEVLRLWAGLGYYRRARDLHRAAREVVAHHRGHFPGEMEGALALPGVGRYTAAAVLSMAYGARHAVVDGNVARVLARLGALRGDLRAPRRWRQLEGEAQRLLAPSAPGEWNQAMMELGATVCTPRAPRCGDCPVASGCTAYRLGIAAALPEKRRERAPRDVGIAAAVLLDRRGRTLLVRQDAGLFSRLWQFPAVEVRRDAPSELAAHVRRMCGNHRSGLQLAALPPARHGVTHHRITLMPFLAKVERLPRVAGARATPLHRLDRLPISSATRKIALAARRAT